MISLLRSLLTPRCTSAAPANDLAAGLDASIASRRAARLAAPPRASRRFDRARAKAEQLRHDHARQLVDF